MKKAWTIGALLGVLLIAGCANEPKTVDNSTKAGQENIHSSEKTNNATSSLNLDELFPDETTRTYIKENIGKKAPDFTLTNLKGKDISLSDFKGKDVIVEIAQTTCGACIQAQPEMDKFQSKHPEIPVIQAFPFENKAAVHKFLKKLNSPETDTILSDEHGNTMIRDYKAKWTPTMYFINKQGMISFVYVGNTDVKQMEEITQHAF
ncbi:TlpA disulfide reductase family protein [Paenibacillus polymyxa]|uniref:TlpA disulfide reductase family protein n=1 Tax=Paenibacillus polymyxa TaxID=1406 RepID=UPI0001E6CD54|nr:TlpA disulfide reductase family protein [Paenibacillus polymyxa]WPQ59620.1 TlpA disulfide reductase family protein [Paenibacillus polymyxa]